MATLVLSTAGEAIGSQFGPIGAAIGRATGAFLGSAIDRRIFGTDAEGPRLGDVAITSAGEGVAIPRAYGTVRTPGHLIWATRFEEDATEERQGGKGGPTITTFSYYGNAAYALCEGPIAMVRRIWADGRELDLTEVDFRVHRGTEDQLPDPLIAAKQGTEVPAYRGTAYVVFERLPLDRFGNRLPQFSFEVIRSVNDVARRTRAITVIPGASEFVYAPVPVVRQPRPGEGEVLNRHVLHAQSDWTASIDELQALCPNLKTVSLVVSWFGDSLDAAQCRVEPRVEVAERVGLARDWSVAGRDRAAVRVVSSNAGTPAFGGTPDDRSVRDAIRDLRARGLEVFLYPFLLMDVPPGNGLPDPYGGSEQPAFPWRGRISCSPAPGHDGSPDATGAVEDIVAAFVGNAQAPNYAAMVEHYVDLAVEAGGVDGFVLGSELRGLTRLRDASGAFPFVAALRDLAALAKDRLGTDCAVTYAADWSEYFGYQPADGSGDVFFNLDPLWADGAVDAVGIDNYMPLSDFRDADRYDGGPDGQFVQHDVPRLRANIAAGEGYDWFYASPADRDARVRTPITDGTHGKPWVFRYKDLVSWWTEPHHERRGGVELDEPTEWRPRSKPIWFTELGAPAVDKAANQPNVFPDPKSSESARPYFSDGARDDLAQHSFLQAHLEHWTENGEDAGVAVPVDPSHIFAWTWDARPFPAFPVRDDVWSDGDNWSSGHWVNGRFAGGPLGAVIREVLADHGFHRCDASAVDGWATGLLLRDPSNARTSLETVLRTHEVEVVEEEGQLVFTARRARDAAPAELVELVDRPGRPVRTTTRLPAIDAPSELALSHADPLSDHAIATQIARSPIVERGGRLAVATPLVIEAEEATRAGASLLDELTAERERVEVSVPWRASHLRAGMLVSLGEGPAYRISSISDGTARRLELVEAPDPVGPRPAAQARRRAAPPVIDAGLPAVVVVDVPPLPELGIGPFVGASRYPWRQLSALRRVGEGAARPIGSLTRPALMGTLISPLLAGPVGAPDLLSTLSVGLPHGAFQERPWLDVLLGANAVAVECTAGWEVLQFGRAVETGRGEWRLTRLLRARLGTDEAMRSGAPSGASVVVLDRSLLATDLPMAERGVEADWIVGPAGASASLERFALVRAASGLEAVTPRSPVHLRVRSHDGGLLVDWVRRGRVDADSWLPADIPLGEEREAYHVRFEGADRVAAFETSTPSFVYPAAAIAANGHERGPLSVSVAQMGTHVAEGHRTVRIIRA